jgi:2-methylisocitrate lyase-like PEP mutase family enzyme
VNKERQVDLAERFRDLHTAPDLLVLPNAWDAGSAIIFEKEGFSAVGTTSAGIAYSLGYPDGEQLTLADLLEVEQRILRRLTIPLSVDIETGYGDDVAQIVSSVMQVLELGAVGINLEDGLSGASPRLFDVTEQCEKIDALSGLRKSIAVPFVINARTDVFWLQLGEAESRLAEALGRANAYLEAGADCIFAPGNLTPDLMRDLSAAIPGPLNVIATPNCPSVAELEELGVARLSLGSGPVRAALGVAQKIARELKGRGTYTSMYETTIPYEQANLLFG